MKAAEKTKPLAIFDIDDTIFRSSLTVELTWALVGYGIFPPIVNKEIEHYCLRWVNRKGGYEDYINQVVKTFNRRIEGCLVKDVCKVSEIVIKEQKDKVYRFTRDLIQRLRKTHILVAISGSLLEIVKIFAKKWGFQIYFGTYYFSSQGRYSGEINPILNDKEKIILDLKEKMGWSLKKSIGVRDTEADAKFLKLVSWPICFNPNQKLYNLAQKFGWQVVVERKDVIYFLSHKNL